MYTTAMWTSNGLILSRILFLLLATKWPSVCKLFIYVRFLEFLTHFATPSDSTMQASIGFYFSIFLKDFISFYFEYWSSMLLGLVEIFLFFMSRQIYHGELISENSGFMTQTLLQWIAYTTFTHCVYSKMGF